MNNKERLFSQFMIAFRESFCRHLWLHPEIKANIVALLKEQDYSYEQFLNIDYKTPIGDFIAMLNVVGLSVHPRKKRDNIQI